MIYPRMPARATDATALARRPQHHHCHTTSDSQQRRPDPTHPLDCSLGCPSPTAVARWSGTRLRLDQAPSPSGATSRPASRFDRFHPRRGHCNRRRMGTGCRRREPTGAQEPTRPLSSKSGGRGRIGRAASCYAPVTLKHVQRPDDDTDPITSAATSLPTTARISRSSSTTRGARATCAVAPSAARPAHGLTCSTASARPRTTPTPCPPTASGPSP